jgi:hypothetical protein
LKRLKKVLQLHLSTTNTCVELGLVVQHPKKITFGADSFRCRFEIFAASPVNTDDSGPKLKSADQMSWDVYCSEYGFKPEDYGKQFVSNEGKKMTLIGINPRNRKYPIITMSSGKRYKVSEKSAKIGLSQ